MFDPDSASTVDIDIQIPPPEVSSEFPGIKLIQLTPIKVEWIAEWANHSSTKHQRAKLDGEIRIEKRWGLGRLLEECGRVIGREVTKLEMLSKKEADRCIKTLK